MKTNTAPVIIEVTPFELRDEQKRANDDAILKSIICGRDWYVYQVSANGFQALPHEPSKGVLAAIFRDGKSVSK